jgi:hypothetical protein
MHCWPAIDSPHSQEEKMKHSLILLVAVLAFVPAACGGDAPAAATQAPAKATTTPTKAPTETPRPTMDLTATADAVAVAAAAATATQLLELIGPDLELAGYSSDIGELAWTKNQTFVMFNTTPGSIKVSGLDPLGLDSPFSAANFVMGVDVTWDSATGRAGCGIIFRAQENLLKGEEAVFAALRLSGFPGWDIELWKFGQIQANLVGHVQTSSAINQDAGSNNHYVISADGTTINVYANGERLGTTELKATMSEGLFGFANFEESGTTTCTFSNTWIWTLP